VTEQLLPFTLFFGPKFSVFGDEVEFLPLTLNQRKSAKVGQRQIDLARRWRKLGDSQ